MKIKTKIHVYSTIWLLVTLVLINCTIYFLFSKITTDSEVEQLQAHVGTIARSIQDMGQEWNANDLLRAYVPTSGMIRVINDENETISVFTKENRLTEVPIQYSQSEGQAFYTLADGERMSIVYFPLIWSDGSVVTLEVSESLAPVQANMNALLVVLLISSLFVLIPILFGGSLLSRVIVQPITSIVKTMREIQERGTFKKIELKQKSKDEIYTLADTFNEMIERLRLNFNRQQQFVSDASHELKTPLTVIESYANLLKRWGTTKPDVLDEAIESISTEAKRMRALTEQMLTLARDEAGAELHFQKTDVVSLCIASIQPFLHIYEHRNVRIQNEHEQIEVMTDEQKLKQVLYILLDNALKYSTADITVHIGCDAHFASIRVEDYGVGIPEQDLAHIFDRFYRVDEARTREKGGSGLGLSIAYSIVHALAGTIHVESEVDKGTIVEVRLSSNFNHLHSVR